MESNPSEKEILKRQYAELGQKVLSDVYLMHIITEEEDILSAELQHAVLDLHMKDKIIVYNLIPRAKNDDLLRRILICHSGKMLEAEVAQYAKTDELRNELADNCTHKAVVARILAERAQTEELRHKIKAMIRDKHVAIELARKAQTEELAGEIWNDYPGDVEVAWTVVRAAESNGWRDLARRV